MAEVDEVAEGIYRIATFVPRFGLTFNQFLIVDEQPLLFHTGTGGCSRRHSPVSPGWSSRL